MRISDLRRARVATFVRPGEDVDAEAVRVEHLYCYVVPHPAGTIVFDTGFSEADPESAARYRPRRVQLPDALRSAGFDLEDVRTLANCHLHFDHIGSNRLLAGVPTFVQRVEWDTAIAGDYTKMEDLQFPGARYEFLDGETEIADGVSLLPTPGHSAGHQSMVVRCTDGIAVLAGQTHDTTSGWSADVAALELRGTDDDPSLPQPPAWLGAVMQLDPQRVFFAHDVAVWRPENPT